MVGPGWRFPGRSEGDVGEALQSDVMRFVAILGLCLVAIFALVQSVPTAPTKDPSSDSPAPRVLPPTPPVSRVVGGNSGSNHGRRPGALPEVVAPMGGDHLPMQAVSELSPATRRPRIPPVEEARPSQPEPGTKVHSPRVSSAASPPQSAGDAPSEQGLMLRFASDSALIALVARRRVGVYARVGGEAWRLSSAGGVLRFVSATSPALFHAMSPNTVPADVITAFEDLAVARPQGDIGWAVSLPTDIQRQLQPWLARSVNGTLLIQADGQLRFHRGR